MRPTHLPGVAPRDSELQAKRGSTLAKDLIVQTRSGRGSYKPFLHSIARGRPRGRAVRLPEQTRLPKSLTLEQVAAVIDAQERLRGHVTDATTQP